MFIVCCVSEQESDARVQQLNAALCACRDQVSTSFSSFYWLLVRLLLACCFAVGRRGESAAATRVPAQGTQRAASSGLAARARAQLGARSRRFRTLPFCSRQNGAFPLFSFLFLCSSFLRLEKTASVYLSTLSGVQLWLSIQNKDKGLLRKILSQADDQSKLAATTLEGALDCPDVFSARPSLSVAFPLVRFPHSLLVFSFSFWSTVHAPVSPVSVPAASFSSRRIVSPPLPIHTQPITVHLDLSQHNVQELHAPVQTSDPAELKTLREGIKSDVDQSLAQSEKRQADHSDKNASEIVSCVAAAAAAAAQSALPPLSSPVLQSPSSETTPFSLSPPTVVSSPPPF